MSTNVRKTLVIASMGAALASPAMAQQQTAAPATTTPIAAPAAPDPAAVTSSAISVSSPASSLTFSTFVGIGKGFRPRSRSAKPPARIPSSGAREINSVRFAWLSASISRTRSP